MVVGDLDAAIVLLVLELTREGSRGSRFLACKGYINTTVVGPFGSRRLL
jgi:hypothetical protein